MEERIYNKICLECETVYKSVGKKVGFCVDCANKEIDYFIEVNRTREQKIKELEQQLQEQEHYVKALEYAINKQRNSNLKLCMFKDLGMCVLTHNWIPIIEWYRNEVNNEA